MAYIRDRLQVLPPPSSPAARRAFVAWLAGMVAPSALARTWMLVDSAGTVHLGNDAPPQEKGVLTWLGPDAHSPLPHDLPPPYRLPGYDRVKEFLRQAAREHGLDAGIVVAVAAVESAFNPLAVSPKGAVGLMQVLPSSARLYGLTGSDAAVREALFDPAVNAKIGARILADLQRRWPDRLELVLAAYNAGVRAVERWQNTIPPFKETERYVPKVLTLYLRWRHLV